MKDSAYFCEKKMATVLISVISTLVQAYKRHYQDFWDKDLYDTWLLGFKRPAWNLYKSWQHLYKLTKDTSKAIWYQVFFIKSLWYMIAGFWNAKCLLVFGAL